ncbi:MAG: electron transfer flavoprotein subunit alpha/FixB family protein [Deltaproteobacteria bacterium]|nr:MAG: electron transfer flavoprotein subunit alpha/FixB family protein [Deltaproteobacteria bacterium]
MRGGIWTYAEERKGELPESSLEAIGAARRLADQRTGGRVTVVLLGERAEMAAALPGRHGADRVFWAEEERVSRHMPEFLTGILSGLIGRYDPFVFLFPATESGRDIAPRVAAKVRAPLFPDCDGLEWSTDGFLSARRLTHGRKVHVTAVCRNARPQMATLVPGAGRSKEASAKPAGADPEIVRLDLREFSGWNERKGVTFVGHLRADPATVDISDAETIVAGGKGACVEDGFRWIERLAEAIGASVAGSRAAVDLGCIGRERQIGQSGKAVSPRLLISCGISGANAHVVGMRDSRTVVAINTDRNAPMLALADLAVVGDLREVLPALIDRIRSGGILF